MRKHSALLCTSMIGLVVIYLLTSCAGQPKPPIFADPDLNNIQFEAVTLLPIVDRRADKSYNLDLESSIGKRVEKNIKKKGYSVIRQTTFSDTLQVTNEEIAEMEPYELQALGTENTEYMLIVYLDDALGKTGFGYTFKIEATALLINKQTGAMLWKDKGIGSQGQAGLAGCLMSGATKAGAMDECVKNILSSFPKNPRKRK